MIKMQVIGRLGKDCVVNAVNGKNVINFTVAHSEKYRDSQGNNQEKTIWVDCAYWTDRTAVSPYLTKGTQVFVEGSPEVRSFTRQDGTAGASLSLRVREVQLLVANQTMEVQHRLRIAELLPHHRRQAVLCLRQMRLLNQLMIFRFNFTFRFFKIMPCSDAGHFSLIVMTAYLYVCKIVSNYWRLESMAV